MLVGRLAAGEWSSTVPDRLVFEGRAPVLVGQDVAAARAAVEEAVAAAGAGHVELRWTGATFASAATPPDDPLVALAAAAVRAERGAARLAGVPWGADFRLFRARGIPAVMVGPRGHRPGPRGRRARRRRRPRGAHADPRVGRRGLRPIEPAAAR